MAEGPSNYLSISSSSGHFVNLLCYMKSKHFLAMLIKIKLFRSKGRVGPKMGYVIFFNVILEDTS